MNIMNLVRKNTRRKVAMMSLSIITLTGGSLEFKQCAPAPSSPTNCKVYARTSTGAVMDCDNGPFTGITQFRTIIRFRTSDSGAATTEQREGPWALPGQGSGAVVPGNYQAMGGYITSVGYQTR